MASDQLVFVPLGGVGEIGMNLALYGFGKGRERKWLAVDMGVSFAKEDLPGVDGILPDIDFLVERKRNLVGIAITHAHEDHFGALFELWPELQVPVFMTPFSAGLLAAKKESEAGAPEIAVKIVQQGGRVTAGPFELEYIPMSHSIPEPNAIAIRTPAGLVLHSGDWKLDPTPLVGKATDSERLQAIGEEGVLALICDSTNAIRDGVSPSEAEVATVLEDIIAASPNRVVVTTFASNIARLRTVALAAQKAGREVVVIGRAMQRALAVADEMGYLKGVGPIRDQEAFGYLPRDKVLALMTGSQGEPRAALARIATGDHRDVALASGDRVIFSSRTIPGNERSVNGIINALVDQGVEIMTDTDGLVHVSGHPRRDELRQMYAWTKPEILVPVHGEARHLHEHAKLARAEGIPQVVELRNGRMVRLSPGPAEIINDVKSGRLYRDGKLLLHPDVSGVADRRRLSFAGSVTISLAMATDGDLLDDPQIAMIGLPMVDNDGNAFAGIVEDAVENALASLPKPRLRDPATVREAVRRAVRNEVANIWGKKPATAVLVSVIEDE
jgi:ribonuclease J